MLNTFKALKTSKRPKETTSSTFLWFPCPKVEQILFPVSSPVTGNRSQIRLGWMVPKQIHTEMISIIVIAAASQATS